MVSQGATEIGERQMQVRGGLRATIYRKVETWLTVQHTDSGYFKDGAALSPDEVLSLPPFHFTSDPTYTGKFVRIVPAKVSKAAAVSAAAATAALVV